MSTRQTRADHPDEAVALTPTQAGRHRRLTWAMIATAMTVSIGLTACAPASGSPAHAAHVGQGGDQSPVVEDSEQADASSATGTDGGVLPDDATPFDTTLPALAHMDPALLQAVQQAATDAEARDIHFIVTSGWRSRAYQQQLLDAAITKYGSEEEASRYVSTPDTSHHVTGNAVDIGPTDAADWLGRHGARYGLCQTYANEIWHFELVIEPGGTCPPMKEDASG